MVMNIKKTLFLSIFLLAFALYGNDSELDMDYLNPLLEKGDSKNAIPYLLKHINSESRLTRSKIYFMLRKKLFERDPSSRRYITEILSSRGNTDSGKIYEYLYSISPEYFTETAKQNLFKNTKRNEDGTIVRGSLLLGHANVTEAIPLLKRSATKYESAIKKSHEKIRKFKEENPGIILPNWRIMSEFGGEAEKAALPYREALARMGDKKELDYCLNYYRRNFENQAALNHKNNPDRPIEKLRETSQTNYAKNYAYIRQPETSEILRKMLFLKDEPNLKPPHRQLNKYAFDALVKCMMIDDAVPKDRFGNYIPNKENIGLLRQWMKEKYTPEKIKSLSVLIDGKLVNNYASAKTVQSELKSPETKKKIKKTTLKPTPKTTTVRPSKPESQRWYLLPVIIIALLGAIFTVIKLSRKKTIKK